jgi:hypothetical protein
MDYFVNTDDFVNMDDFGGILWIFLDGVGQNSIFSTARSVLYSTKRPAAAASAPPSTARAAAVIALRLARLA